MTKSKGFFAIDIFRVIAALLVVCVHTGPLSSYSENANFILTSVVARLAVPFFFTTLGFFLITQYTKNNEALFNFIKKTAVIYILSILVFIPLNIYNGYFSEDNLVSNIIKDIFFDGTVYHLWYLPAAIIGSTIAWFLCKKVKFHAAFCISIGLYAIGLMGDSYFGLLSQSNFFGFSAVYDFLFAFFDYTRNGLFFAPIFFVLGGYLKSNRITINLTAIILGFFASFAFMLTESMLLHKFSTVRHDSMYIFLLPCIFFLFLFLLSFNKKRPKGLSSFALLVYIFHPMVIVVLRFIAKKLNWQGVLLDNSIVYFLCVSVLSSLVSMLFMKLFLNKKHDACFDKERSWVEINLDNLAHNLAQIKAEMPAKSEFMAVIKSGAYGHGAFEISTALSKLGIKSFAVATIEEGIALRKYGISGNILILGYTMPSRAKDLSKYSLTQSLVSLQHAKALNRYNYKIKAHLQVDTGMHRLGFSCEEIDKIADAFALKNLNICGIYTHLCVCDSLKKEDIDFTYGQISKFYSVTKSISQYGIDLPKTHIQSSYGLLNYPQLNCDYIRVGISLYGVSSAKNDLTNLQLDLRPVLALKSRVVLIRDIPAGDTVGYGRAFSAGKDSRIAVLPIGYADGLPRNLSGKNFEILINGKRVPIVGRICMDQLMADVTGLENLKLFDVATLIGKDNNDEIFATDMSDCSDSITNEILCRMGTRLKIITVKNNNF